MLTIGVKHRLAPADWLKFLLQIDEFASVESQRFEK
jgi:hypothetical protein